MNFDKLPKNWSELTWQQLNDLWRIKLRYAANADVARAAAMLALLFPGLHHIHAAGYDPVTGEKRYLIPDSQQPKADGQKLVTARQLAYYAKEELPWFDFPYGDPGQKEERDAQGNIVREHRPPHTGYVSALRDALILPQTEIRISRRHHFALPQAACNNLTWQQYRAVQDVAGELFAGGGDDAGLLQARFLAHILTPRSLSLADTSDGLLYIHPHYSFTYKPSRARELVPYWQRLIKQERIVILFHIVFQTYQTALSYYAGAYPLLFSSSKSEVYKDALAGEIGTVNAVMKYASYTDQQAVYDSNLPFVLDILNTMAKEASEIEKMNAKIKKR